MTILLLLFIVGFLTLAVLGLQKKYKIAEQKRQEAKLQKERELAEQKQQEEKLQKERGALEKLLQRVKLRQERELVERKRQEAEWQKERELATEKKLQKERALAEQKRQEEKLQKERALAEQKRQEEKLQKERALAEQKRQEEKLQKERALAEQKRQEKKLTPVELEEQLKQQEEKARLERIQQEEKRKQIQLQEQLKKQEAKQKILGTRNYRANWSQYESILKQNNIVQLYHFTDESNIASIKSNGGLFSWWYSSENGIIIPRTGGGELSRNLDQRYYLEDYVRLSFTPNHPMMFIAQKDGRISNPVILRISLDVCYWENTKFSNMNATRNGHNCGERISDLQKIHFETVKKKNHFDLPDDEKPYYQAEVLVKTCIPIQYITF